MKPNVTKEIHAARCEAQHVAGPWTGSAERRGTSGQAASHERSAGGTSRPLVQPTRAEAGLFARTGLPGAHRNAKDRSREKLNRRMRASAQELGEQLWRSALRDRGEPIDMVLTETLQASPGVAQMVQVPSAYAEGYAKARHLDPEAANNYIRHTAVGDPELDPVMDELSGLPPPALHMYIKAGIEQQADVLRSAPQALRDFFDKVDHDVPSWVDFDSYWPGTQAFFANMGNMLIAYAVGSAVEGFSTLVSKSFSISGRVTGLGAGAERRLRQNNRHMVEVYYPDGLKRGGDGWKISTRIRFIHSQMRRLLGESDAWDHEAWGTPLSASHVGGIALFTFSIRQFEHAISMGSSISQEQRDAIVRIWRYAGYLLGVPESILFTNEQEARRTYEIGHLCEPAPDVDAVGVANAVFKAIPQMAGVTGEAETKSLQMYAYRLSRALIGNKLADQYGYPNTIRVKFLVLTYYRVRQLMLNLMAGRQRVRVADFTQIFEAAQYDAGGISYRMPDHARSAKQSPW